MIWRRRITLGVLVLAALACADRDAELREEFRTASLALADQLVPGSSKYVKGRDGWILHRLELQFVTDASLVGESAIQSHGNPPEKAGPASVIIDFHRQLQERGIDMYLMPIPVRPVIYPESVLGPEPFAERETIPNLHPSLQEFLSVLREGGVRVIDLTPTFLSEREHPEHGAVFCPSDTHWTPYGILVAAKILAAEIKEKPWFDSVPKQRYRQRWITKTHNGLIYRKHEKATGTAPEPDPVPIRRIMLETEEGLKKFGLQNPECPVIVIGDSNTVRWANYSSGLAHSLAFELGFPVDVLSAAGGGANTSRLNLIRKARTEPGYLEGKRVVIWCFTARALTGTPEGWIPMSM